MTEQKHDDACGASRSDAGLGMNSDWVRGYYCAVAVLLREEGGVTQLVRSLFRQGGNVALADKQDRELFREHGLPVPNG
jgi:hypothetical protein